MGRRHPPLSPAELISVLHALGFSFKRQTGSHAHYERPADATRPRSLVTVDMSLSEFWERVMRSMVRQSNFSRDEFYGATRRTAKKAGM